MNLRMASTSTVGRTVYSLEVYQLHYPYRDADSLQNSTLLHHYESQNPFGEFHVGDTFAHSRPSKYLGRIEHIHHWVGDDGGSAMTHRILLYVHDAVLAGKR
jgi:hypothetical protein